MHKRPNIVFIMTDDHTPGEMSSYGHPSIKTPNLDRIGEEGTRFTNSYTTNALCAPARGTVLTGAFSHIHGIRGNSMNADAIESLDPNVPTFPELLRAQGYQTALVGKYHIRQNPRGFDHWVIHPGQGEYFDPVLIENGTKIQMKGYATDITGDLALQVLENRDRSRPFCLLYQFKAPHRPFAPAPRHAHLFENLEIPEPASFNDDYATRRVAATAEDMCLERSLAGDYPELPEHLDRTGRKRWIYQRMMKDRLRTMLGVDENVGRVLDYLDAENLTADTLVIYTSDHGYFLGEHGWYDKRFMYEPSIRIPLVMRYPRLGRPGHVADQMVMNVDFMPTILEAAGISPPSTVQGASLLPLLQGRQPDDWRSAIYYAYYDNTWELAGKRPEELAERFAHFTPHRIGPHRGIRTQRFKLIEYYSEGDYWELFDLEKDPEELNNLYGDPAMAGVQASLKTELTRIRKLYKDSD